MKKLFTMALAVGMLCNAQAADLYKASRNVALRAPAVPLITSDPYLSIWSPTDALNGTSFVGCYPCRREDLPLYGER